MLGQRAQVLGSLVRTIDSGRVLATAATTASTAEMVPARPVAARKRAASRAWV